MSASSKPTLNFFWDKHIAKFVETVDFPTPPLPEPTTIIFFIFQKLYILYKYEIITLHD